VIFNQAGTASETEPNTLEKLKLYLLAFPEEEKMQPKFSANDVIGYIDRAVIQTLKEAREAVSSTEGIPRDPAILTITQKKELLQKASVAARKIMKTVIQNYYREKKLGELKRYFNKEEKEYLMSLIEEHIGKIQPLQKEVADLNNLLISMKYRMNPFPALASRSKTNTGSAPKGSRTQPDQQEASTSTQETKAQKRRGRKRKTAAFHAGLHPRDRTPLIQDCLTNNRDQVTKKAKQSM